MNAAIKTRCCAILLVAVSSASILDVSSVAAATTISTAHYTDTDVANTGTSNTVNDASYALRSSSRHLRRQQQRRQQEEMEEEEMEEEEMEEETPSFAQTTQLWHQLGCDAQNDGENEGSHSCMACDFLNDQQQPQEPPPPGAFSFRMGRETSQTCSGGIVTTNAGDHKCLHVDLQAYLSLEELGSSPTANGIGLNEIWGWTDVETAREFALIGDMTGTIIVEVTVATEPVVVGRLDMGIAGEGSYWTDIKVVGDHAYISKDYLEGEQGHGLQIFNLRKNLLDVKKEDAPVTFSDDGRYTGFDNAHNLAVNTDTQTLFVLGSNAANKNSPETCDGLYILNINGNPTNPEFVGCYDGAGYIHDAQCTRYHGPDDRYTDSDICFTFNLPKNEISIIDMTDQHNIKKLSTTKVASSDTVKWAHQGWLTPDQATLIYNHEDKQQDALRVIDVSDLENPSIPSKLEHATDNFNGILHNMFSIGDYYYEATYRAGLRIFEITPEEDGNREKRISLKEVGYFDTYAKSDGMKFNGAFGVYPFFSSGNVIVSDIETGLFILKPKNEFHARTRDGVAGCVDDPNFMESESTPDRDCKWVQAENDKGNERLCHNVHKNNLLIRDLCPQACNICKRSDEGAPTGSPTGSPIGPPTRTPTGAPIGPPTGTPTRTPTLTPTRKPTRTPTVKNVCKTECHGIFNQCMAEISSEECQEKKCNKDKKKKKKSCRKAKKKCKKEC